MLKPQTSRFLVLISVFSCLGMAVTASAEQAPVEGPFVVNLQEIRSSAPLAAPAQSIAVPEHQHQIPADPIRPSASLRSAPAPFALASPQTLAAAPLPASPASFIDFMGVQATGWNPPDTNGAVSDKYVLSTVNNRYSVHDRSGNLLASADLNTFWAPTGSPGNSFDSRSRFDPYSKRFIILSGGSLGGDADASILIGVSQTEDPTGGWNLYRIPADAPANLLWADYATIGFNAKWIVVHANMFPGSKGGNFTTRMWVFNKANLYAGLNGANTVLPGVGVTAQPAETYDPVEPDLYLLQQGDNSSVNLFRVTGAVGAERSEFVARVAAPEAWTGNIPHAPQKDSTQLIRPGINWMMDAVYRNGAVWGTQVVQPLTGPSRAAAQWWRIGKQGNLIDFGRVDDPTGNTFYGFPSIAVNAANDALIGYTRFTADSFPSAGYSLRLNTDPAGSVREGFVYRFGGSIFPGDRWGDFSHTQVDPANDKDFWTVQETTLAFGSWVTWWGQVKVPTVDTPNISVKFMIGDGQANTSKPRFRIKNNGTTALDMASLTLRYWLNCDCVPATTVMQSWVDWVGLLPSGATITSRASTAIESATAVGQTHALVVRFAAGTLVKPGEEIEVQTRFNKPDWSAMNQTNDWSFANFTTYTPWARVAVYQNGSLILGQQP